MPWSLNQRDGKWCVVKADGEVEGCHESRTDAIKQQRALYANESRVAAIYDELDALPEEPRPVLNGKPVMPAMGNPKIDERLQAAMELISEFTQDPPQPHPIHVTVENDTPGMRALVAALDQITTRLVNGERVSESLVASLQNLADLPAPVVNVESPTVNVPAPVVNVQAPNVNVSVPRPEVTVLPPASKTITFERDFDGRVTKADVVEGGE